MICQNCGKEFVLNQKGRGGSNRIFCYDCMPSCSDRNTRKKLRYNLLMAYSNKLKLERGCDRCGYNKCAKALEWHHPDNNKTKEPAVLLHRSIEAYLQETNKCILLCANCHREIQEQ